MHSSQHISVWALHSEKKKSHIRILIQFVSYLLTLLAIIEKLYCAVLSLSSNSLVAMVPSVASIVK